MTDELSHGTSTYNITARIGLATLVALLFSLCVYFLLSYLSAPFGLISFTFLMILPAFTSTLISFFIDPHLTRRLRFHMIIPWIFMGGAAVAAAVFLDEGLPCIIMLIPFWVISGSVGIGIAYSIRVRMKSNKLHVSLLLILPFIAAQFEANLSPSWQGYSVERSIVINASPEKIWPLVQGIPNVAIKEGRWNLSQDVIGIPRPKGAHLVGSGIGAERLASWTHNIKFREEITQWNPNRRIGWSFIFDDVEKWDFTDQHLLPNTRHLRVIRGGYTLIPISANATKLVIDTYYESKTSVNGYAAIWGQFFIGDIENNLLMLIRQRAEAR